MIDRAEQQRRGQPPRKYSTKHLYAAIEHRVIDSPAFADLTFSARALLVELARQLTQDNNGHLQATFSYMGRRGFSENTLSRGIKELIAHGFIYRTRAGGYQHGMSLYAVTWLPIKDRKDIFIDGFQACAWRDWSATDKKLLPPNLRTANLKKEELTVLAHPKSAASPPPKTEDYELVPIGSCLLPSVALLQRSIKPVMTYRPLPANQSRYQPFRYSA